MCIDCLNNCPDPISDKCITYTGGDIACLGIKSGDSLYAVEVAIAEKLCIALEGTGIVLSNFDVCCDFLSNILGTKEKTLANILEMLADGACSLRELIQELEDSMNTPYSFNTACLTGLGASPTRDDILNAALNKLCSVSTRVSVIENDYVKNSELCTKINLCLNGNGTIAQESLKMPKFVAMPYHGPLSVFDSMGQGLEAFGYNKVYICNGQVVGSFVTPDYRGRSPLGANVGVPGGVLDSSVNPSLTANSGYSINMGTKQGSYTDTLSVDTMPSHTHLITDPGHKHNFPGQKFSSHPSGGSSQEYRDVATQETASSTTGITISSTGNTQPHNNLAPIVGCAYIMYIP